MDGHPHSSPLDVLVRLVDKSLVQIDAASAAEPRYRLLEMIRQYALDRLREAGEETALRRRHLAWFSRLPAPDEAPHDVSSGAAGIARVAADLDNLRAALAWSVSDADASSARTGLCLASALFDFWFARFQLAEGYHWLERTLAADGLYAREEDWLPRRRRPGPARSDRRGHTRVSPR